MIQCLTSKFQTRARMRPVYRASKPASAGSSATTATAPALTLASPMSYTARGISASSAVSVISRQRTKKVRRVASSTITPSAMTITIDVECRKEVTPLRRAMLRYSGVFAWNSVLAMSIMLYQICNVLTLRLRSVFILLR